MMIVRGGGGVRGWVMRLVMVVLILVTAEVERHVESDDTGNLVVEGGRSLLRGQGCAELEVNRRG